MTRLCGFTFTTTGRPCANRVEVGAVLCRSGHPCPPIVLEGLPRLDQGASSRRSSRGKRATEILGRALAGDDAETLGLRAEEVLADPELALVLLGGPSPVEAARNVVVQRYGRVGALLVVGYEDRFTRRLSTQASEGLRLFDHHHRDVAPAGDRAGQCVETLIQRFATMDAGQIDGVLTELDTVEGRGHDDETIKARRWLHATYAVAGRDRRDEAHRAYMVALDGVMQVARGRIAS